MSALHGQLTEEQIAEIRAVIASERFKDDCDDEGTGEEDIDIDVDLHDDPDPESVNFLDEYSKIFGAEETSEMQEEVFHLQNFNAKPRRPSSPTAIAAELIQDPNAGVQRAADILDMPRQPTSDDHAEWHRYIAHNMQSGQEDGIE
ncbi:hypothetical protein B0H14DRAFT_2599025 [Mycena olivaceomarginata]|nr:hypothetical protein B0H14DRAFT_2599025 [Mycena olivaceomarginata]